MKRNALIILTASLLAALPAAASHPTYDDMEEVERLAHELARTARDLHRDAEDQAHHLSRRESYALEHLHQLEAAAYHFHEQVERSYQNPGHTEADFRRLHAAYRDALDTFPELHAYGRLYRELGRMRAPMGRLAAYYGYGYGDGAGYDDGHGRNDRRGPTYRGRRSSPRWHFSIGWRN